MRAPRLEDSLSRRMEALVEEMCAQEIHLPLALRELERRFLQAALRRCGGNRTRAARLLGIHRNTLTHKLHNHTL